MARCPIPGAAAIWPHVLANATRRLKAVLTEVRHSLCTWDMDMDMDMDDLLAYNLAHT